MMGETNFRTPMATSITTRIADDQLKDVARDGIKQYTETEYEYPAEQYFVRVRKNQQTIAFTLNTRRMVERREIERSNEMKRASGK